MAYMCMQACTPASVRACYFLACSGQYLSQICQIRGIKVSMESGEHARPVWACSLTQACMLACIHSMCLCAQAHILAKLGRNRRIKLSMESGEHAKPVWAHNMIQACNLACMHAMCFCSWTITQPNSVGSERSKYLWNLDNMQVLSEHIIHPNHRI